jgi:hypothetical protein
MKIMKKVLLFGLFLFALSNANAQMFQYGVRLGAATTSINSTPQTIKGYNNTDSLAMQLQSSNFGIHVGGFARVTVGPIFFQPEVLFNTKSQEYTIVGLQDNQEQVLEDRFTSLDVPLIVGYKMSALRLQAGVIGSMTLTNSNDLIEHFSTQEDLVSTLQGFNWGWQTGLGLDISKFIIDIKYEGNFQRVGNDIQLYGRTYNFDGRTNRFIVTFGYRF